MWSCCDIQLDSCCADPQLGSNFPDWILWREGVRVIRLFYIKWAESPSEVTPALALGLMHYSVLHIEKSYNGLHLCVCARVSIIDSSSDTWKRKNRMVQLVAFIISGIWLWKTARYNSSLGLWCCVIWENYELVFPDICHSHEAYSNFKSPCCFTVSYLSTELWCLLQFSTYRYAW